MRRVAGCTHGDFMNTVSTIVLFLGLQIATLPSVHAGDRIVVSDTGALWAKRLLGRPTSTSSSPAGRSGSIARLMMSLRFRMRSRPAWRRRCGGRSRLGVLPACRVVAAGFVIGLWLPGRVIAFEVVRGAGRIEQEVRRSEGQKVRSDSRDVIAPH